MITLDRDQNGNELLTKHGVIYARKSSGEWLRITCAGEAIPVLSDVIPADEDPRVKLAKGLEDDRVKMKEKCGLSATLPIAEVTKVETVTPVTNLEKVEEVVLPDPDIATLFHVTTCSDGDELWKTTNRDDVTFEWDSQTDLWIRYDLGERYTSLPCHRRCSASLSAIRESILSGIAYVAPPEHSMGMKWCSHKQKGM